MAKGISLSLKGFDRLLSQLEEAGKDVDIDIRKYLQIKEADFCQETP